MKRLETPIRETAVQTAAILLVVLIFTRLGGLFSLPPTDISAFWPANALLFSGVFLMPARSARMTLLLALPTYFLAELWIGYSQLNAAVYSLANVAEVSVFLWLLRKASIHSLAFDTLKSLFVFLTLALLASPVGGCIGAVTTTWADGDFATVVLRWSLADFFGYCLCVPLVLAWSRWRQFFSFDRSGRIAEFVAFLAILLPVAALSFSNLGLSVPLGAQFLPMPILLWAALRFGPPGGALATFIVASVAFFHATHGVGLFSVGPPDENLASLQLFFASLVVSVMTIASLNAERRKSFDALRQEVSERKRAEEELRENERFLETLLENIPIMLFVKDAKTLKFLRFNRAGEMLLGYSRDELLGKTDYEFFPKEQADYFTSKDRDIIDSRGLLDIPEELIDTRYLGQRVLHTRKIPIYADDESPLYLLGISEDISERKQAEMRIRTLNRELEQRVAERTAQLEAAIYDLENFNYSASHDLRIPLRAIDGFSRILLDEYSEKLDAEGMRLLNVVRENTNRLAQYIDDMQAFSRTGQMAMAPVEIDMQALVRDVLEELKPARDRRDIKLEIDSLPTAYADRPMLRWVFVNLLSNAIKFSRTQASPHIKVGASVNANETVYFIQDNGIGFDMRYADKLFRVFERLHNVNEFEGTGIGLAIVKRIVSRHGGRVWAEGVVGRGATFYFSLPIMNGKYVCENQ